jgi:hypothetical protein
VPDVSREYQSIPAERCVSIINDTMILGKSWLICASFAKYCEEILTEWGDAQEDDS